MAQVAEGGVAGMGEGEMTGDEECRICRGGPEHAPLLHPCRCDGSIRYVHQECLDAWLARTSAQRCELCHHPFNYSPVYASNAPERLSAPEFLLGLMRMAGSKCVLALRLMLVVFLWVMCLPVGTSWMSRLFFLRSINAMFHFRTRLHMGALVADWMQGVLLSLLVVAVFLAVSALRDYLLRQERLENQNGGAANRGAPNPLQPREQQQPPAGLWEPQEEPPQAHEGLAEPGNVRAPRPLPVPGAAQEEPAEPWRNPERGRDEGLARMNRMDDSDDEEDDLVDINLPNFRGIDGGQPAEDFDPELRRALRADAEAEEQLLNFLDGREEEIPLEEFVGLRGPIRVMLENALTALISNAIFIGILTLVPFSIGRVVLWMKHNWHLLVPFTGRELGPGQAAYYYGDAITLLVGYATLILAVLVAAVCSLLFGGRDRLLAPQSLLMRQLITILKYAFILAKVGMLLAIELIAFPTGCGWWLDMCSLTLVDATAADRIAFLKAHFFTAHFLHWLAGVAFMLHVSVFVAVLREVVRPEVLWFLRNPADAEEHPLRDLIDEPLPKHARRILLSLLLYIPLTGALVYLPIVFAKFMAPWLFPLWVDLHDPFSEIPSPLFLFHVSLPLAMEKLRPRDSFKRLLHTWLEGAGQVMGMRDKILPTPVQPLVPSHQSESEARSTASDSNQQENQEEELSMAERRHQRLLLWTKAMTIVAMGFLTLAGVAACCIVAPVGFGRQLLSVAGVNVRHDVYPFAIGFCCLGVLLEGLSRLRSTVESQGVRAALVAASQAALHAVKCGIAGSVLLIASPLLLGVLVDLVVGVPFRVLPNQTPILGTLHHWLVGVLVMKLGVKLALSSPSLAPRWRLLLMEASNQGWRNLRLRWLMVELGLPLLSLLSLLLSLPYAFSWGLLPLLGVEERGCSWWWRWVYPGSVGAVGVVLMAAKISLALSLLHSSLRDSLYLVGRRLHNLS